MKPNLSIIPRAIRLTEDDLAQARLRAVADFDAVGPNGKAMAQYHLSKLKAAGLGTCEALEARYPRADGFVVHYHDDSPGSSSWYRRSDGTVFDGSVQLAHLPTAGQRLAEHGFAPHKAASAVSYYANYFIGPDDASPEGFGFELMHALLEDLSPNRAASPPAAIRAREVLADYASGQPVRLVNLYRTEPEAAKVLARMIGTAGLITLHAGWYQFPHHRTQTPHTDDFFSTESGPVLNYQWG